MTGLAEVLEFDLLIKPFVLQSFSFQSLSTPLLVKQPFLKLYQVAVSLALLAS